MASFPWTGFSYSPPLLVGVVQVALAQTHSLLVSRVLLRGKPGRMPGLEGCTGPAMLSRSQTTGARTRAICCPFHLHSHLMLCQQLSFFTPGTRLILLSPTCATRALGLSWLDITVTQKQRDILPWNTFQNGIIYHKPSSKLHPLLTVMSRFASPLLVSVFESFPSTEQPLSTQQSGLNCWSTQMAHDLNIRSISVWVISTN